MNINDNINELEEIMNNDSLHLYIKTQMNKCYLIIVNRDISICDLKKQICKSINSITDTFDILYNNINLKSGYLEDYSVKNYSTFTIIPNMRTGSGFYKTYTPILSQLISKDDIKSTLNKYLFGTEDLSEYLNNMYIEDSSNNITNNNDIQFLSDCDEKSYYEFIEKMKKNQKEFKKRSQENSRIQEKLTELYYKMKRNKKTISAIKERYKNKQIDRKDISRGYMGLKKGFLNLKI